jgi:hypothetical protein
VLAFELAESDAVLGVGDVEVEDGPDEGEAAGLAGAAAPTGAADAHDSLRKVLGYVHANIIDPACVCIPVPRQAVGPDGTITDPAIRRQIAKALETLAVGVSSARASAHE